MFSVCGWENGTRAYRQEVPVEEAVPRVHTAVSLRCDHVLPGNAALPDRSGGSRPSGDWIGCLRADGRGRAECAGGAIEFAGAGAGQDIVWECGETLQGVKRKQIAPRLNDLCPNSSIGRAR